MTYKSNADLPAPLRKLPVGAQTIYRRAYNAAVEAGQRGSQAAKAAWAAVRESGYQRTPNGLWVKASDPEVETMALSLADMGHIELSDVSDEMLPNARIPVLRKGKFAHPWYGELVFDDNFFSEGINNFYGDVLGHEVPINTSHWREMGALGWWRDVELVGDAFHVLAHLTPEGVDMVKAGKFKYASIEVNQNYVDPETREEHGVVFEALGLTNNPFIIRQEQVTLMSKDGDGAVQVPILMEEIHQEETVDNEEKETVVLTQDNSRVIELEAELAKLREEHRLAQRRNEVDRLVQRALLHRQDGRQLAPAVVDWLQAYLMGAPIGDITLSSDNPFDYQLRAMEYFIFQVLPCTVPTEAQTALDVSKKPKDTAETTELTEDQAQAFWTI